MMIKMIRRCVVDNTTALRLSGFTGISSIFKTLLLCFVVPLQVRLYLGVSVGGPDEDDDD